MPPAFIETLALSPGIYYMLQYQIYHTLIFILLSTSTKIDSEVKVLSGHLLERPGIY